MSARRARKYRIAGLDRPQAIEHDLLEAALLLDDPRRGAIVVFRRVGAGDAARSRAVLAPGCSWIRATQQMFAPALGGGGTLHKLAQMIEAAR